MRDGHTNSTTGKWLARTGPKNPYKKAQLGTLQEGSYADVILVDGNPLDSTDVLADYENTIDLVMIDGVIEVDKRQALRHRRLVAKACVAA